MYQVRKVGGHVFVLGLSSQESGRSCICIRGIKSGKWAVMYLYKGYQVRKVGGHVFVLGVSSQESGRSCICIRGIKSGKWEVMYLY